MMIEKNAVLAGEESGGTAFRGHVCERDGLLAALRILELIAIKNEGPGTLLHRLRVEHGDHRYKRVDFPVDTNELTNTYERLINSVPKELGGIRVLDTDQIDGFRYHLEGGWWVSVRESGTEPLVRIYAETENDSATNSAIVEIARVLGLDH
jgi:phosphomannomutase